MTRLGCACVAAAAYLVVTLGVATAEPKRVLLVHSYFSPWSDWAKHIRSEFDRQLTEPMDVYEYPLTSARFDDEKQEDLFAEYLRTTFADHPVDLIVSVGAPAGAFFQRHRRQLLPSTPMVMAGLEQRRVALYNLTANDTVVAISLDVAGFVEKNIFRVLPGTSNLMVIVGNSPIEKYWLEQYQIALRPFMNRIRFIWTNEMSFNEILKRAAALPPQSAILYGFMVVDATGISRDERSSLSLLHAVANAPVFSFFDDYLGESIVGGTLISMQDTSRNAVSVVMRILRGEAAGDIKTPPIGFGTPKFDWREMQRWGISESRLPPGSEVYFRPASLWDQYRWQLSTVMAAVLIQTAMIIWLLFERRHRRLAELEAGKRLSEVLHLERTATAGALSASIAHELNQPLGAILSNAEAAELLLTANPPDLGEVKTILADIREADQRAAEIIQHMRKLLKQSEIELETFDLNEPIANAMRILSPEAREKGIALTVNGVQRPLPVRADKTHLQQVILNLAINGMDAITSAARGARELTVQTTWKGGSEVEVSVTDSGTGIPKDKLKDVFETFYTTKQQGTGLGLSIARTIIEAYGGRIWAENPPAGGAVFRFTVPLAEAPS